MANLMEMLGVNSQTGLGPVMTAMNSQGTQDIASQQGLANLFKDRIANQSAQLKFGEDQATSGTRVQAVNAENLGKVTEANAGNYQKFGEVLGQLSGSLEGLPPAQRQQALGQIGSKFPGMAESPIFQSLMNTDPNALPGTLRKLGNDIALRSSKFLQDTTLQGQKDTAAMDRTRLTESGAWGRHAAGESGAMARLNAQHKNAIELANLKGKNDLAVEQLKIDAQGGDPIAGLILKEGPEKAAAFFAYKMNNAETPEEATYWEEQGNAARSLAGSFRAAGGTPKQTIDPISGMPVTVDPYGQQWGNPFGGSQPASAPTGTPDIATLVQQAGGSYQPDKYDYRINPQTGQVQRKAKGK